MWYALYFNGVLRVRGLELGEARELASLLVTEFGGRAEIRVLPYR